MSLKIIKKFTGKDPVSESASNARRRALSRARALSLIHI